MTSRKMGARWAAWFALGWACLFAADADRVRIAGAPRAGGKTLLECLWARRSARQFATDPLSREHLARILWAADGLNRPEEKKRTAPSAFTCYPVSIFVVEKGAMGRYEPAEGALVPIRRAATEAEDLRPLVTGPSSFAEAPAIIVLAIDPSLFPEKAEKAMRIPWAHAECGAIGQNVSLACAALDLATVFAAAMDPARIRQALGLAEGIEPVYLMPVGKPKA